MRRGLGFTFLIAVAIAALAVGYLWYFDRPALPATITGSEPYARTSLQPDPSATVIPDAGSVLVASDCPAYLQPAPHVAYLCWVAYRETDTDPGKDFYVIEVGGTFGGNVRWFVLDLEPLDRESILDIEGEPLGTDTGCRPLLVDVIGAGTKSTDQLCGRIVAGLGERVGGWRISWMCDPCLLLEAADRSVSLRLKVTVAEGSIPNWDLYADAGR